jgi:hypothetical protein
MGNITNKLQNVETKLKNETDKSQRLETMLYQGKEES